MRLIALSLLLCLGAGAASARSAGAEGEPLRPLRVDLRLLYPALEPGWQRLDTPGAPRPAARQLPEAAFLAAPAVGPARRARASQAAAPPANAGGLAVARSAGTAARRLRRREETWTVRGGAKGRHTVELGFDPAGLVYPIEVR